MLLKVEELEKRIVRLEKLTKDIARALALMAHEREELSREVREEVEEVLRDYFEGRADRFTSLNDLRKMLLKEK